MSDTLSVAVVHYHLRPGGVTRVIERAVASLRSRPVRFTVLAGPVPSPPPDLPFRPIRELDYREEAPAAGRRGLYERLREGARAGLGRDPDLWHVHNHSLGKNPELADAVAQLADDGARLLLQIHDFAEDGRPADYRRLLKYFGGAVETAAGRLYPAAATAHYAVLNRRDQRRLAAAGIEAGRLHYLANPIALDPPGPDADAAPGTLPRIVYPTRAIRRKNLGELLLWVVLGRGAYGAAVTQAPRNPNQRPFYDGWVKLAADLKLPVEWEAGARAPLGRLIQTAAAVATTSVAEGFGLAFLEPWLVGRPLVGRDLPEITADLKAAGLDLPGLYPRLMIPLEWIGADRFRSALQAARGRVLAAYGRRGGPDDLEQAWAAAVEGERVDFGRLDETMQELVIRRLHGAPGAAAEVQPNGLLATMATAEQVAAHRKQVVHRFSLEPYGKMLEDVYRVVAEAVPGRAHPLDAGMLLDGFLAPESFYFLRTRSRSNECPRRWNMKTALESDVVDHVKRLVEAGHGETIHRHLQSLASPDMALALSRLDAGHRQSLFRLLDPGQAADLLQHLPDEQAADLLEELAPEQAAAIVVRIPRHAQADILADVKAADADAILSAMPVQGARITRRLLSYPPDKAGGLMTLEYLAYPETHRVEEVLADLKAHARQYSDYEIQYAYIVSADQRLRGVLRMRDLLLSPVEKPIGELMIAQPVHVAVNAPLEDLIRLFDRHQFIGVPVVDEDGRLVGVVRRAQALEAYNKRNRDWFLKISGIIGGEELRSMPTAQRSGRRLTWLVINILLNVLAAGVIALYQETLASVIALAVFLPILSDMSGSAGSQALAVSIREMALGLIRPCELWRVVAKEAGVGLLNGLILGGILGLVALFWKGNPYLGLVIGGALALNTVLAACVGGIIPLVLKSLRMDPALAAGLIMTTITDVCAFFFTLSFATLLLPRLV
jgi:magnesium transporter